jgi:hypothetical protein
LDIVESISIEQTGKKSKDHFLKAAEFAVHSHLSVLVDQALAQELITNGATVKPYLILSQLELQRQNYKASEEQIREALFLAPQNEEIWESMGLNF